MANPDDVVPDLPALPPGSEFSYLEGRFHEIFAPVNEADIPRAARFGQRRSYPDGAMLFEVGKPAPGMFVLLSGRVAFSRRDALGRSIPIWERRGGVNLSARWDSSREPMPWWTSKPVARWKRCCSLRRHAVALDPPGQRPKASHMAARLVSSAPSISESIKRPTTLRAC